jgi:DNA recombination protein RmuC
MWTEHDLQRSSTVRELIQQYAIHLLTTGLGLLIGAALAWVLTRNRLTAKLNANSATAQIEQALLRQQVDSQHALLSDWQERHSQAIDEAQKWQARHVESATIRAALESRLEGRDQLAKELSDARQVIAGLQTDLRRESASLAQAIEKTHYLQKIEIENERQRELVLQGQDQVAQYRADLAELRTALSEQGKQSTEKIALLNEAREQLKHEFQNLAQRIFEEKSNRFSDQNRASLGQLINPLREQLGDFKKRVEDVYDKESRDRAALQAEINHLKELNQRIGKEALNLTRALKGDSKIRGNWGEVVLERVLEASGLAKGREYEVQVSCSDPQGKRYQPDVIVRLPEGKDVIIDAKVSLKDYEAFFNSEDPAEKEKALRAHIEALRTHLRQLAAKDYQSLEGVRSLDFVLMFIPVEAAFLAAVEKDAGIFGEAFEKNIMLVSPSTLLVTLRTIQNIWRYEYQNHYALEIAKRAGGLYDKFVGFIESLEEIGNQLDKAKAAFRIAFDRLVSGRGNLVRRTQELKAMGVKATKELPPRIVELAEADPPALPETIAADTGPSQPIIP